MRKNCTPFARAPNNRLEPTHFLHAVYLRIGEPNLRVIFLEPVPDSS